MFTNELELFIEIEIILNDLNKFSHSLIIITSKIV
jgi:hypothetical protein